MLATFYLYFYSYKWLAKREETICYCVVLLDFTLILLLWCFISFQDLIIETEHKLALFLAYTAHLKAEGSMK